MIKVGVLEDEKRNFEKLKECIDRYGEENEIDFEVELHMDGQAFLSDDITKYDIIFLDIEVPLVNGIQVAKKIRERDQDVILFFCTKLTQYAIMGYQVEALDYILKPIKYSSMKFRLDRAMQRLKKNQREEKVILHVNRENIRINISDIYYIEACRHKTIYYTRQGTYEVWSSFKEAKKKFEEHQFVQCHGSYLCSLKWVSCIKEGEVIMADGMAIKMSRNLKKIFSDALTSYWAEEGR